MNTQKLLRYFNLSSIGEIRWLHRAENYEFINKNLASTHFLEIDLRIRKSQIIISHDPPLKNQKSIKLEEIIQTSRKTKKGIKLDFKETRAISPSLQIMKKLQPPEFLTVFHADIVSASENHKKTTINKNYFLNECRKAFPNVLLSIGLSLEERINPKISSKSLKEYLYLAIRFQPVVACFRLDITSPEYIKPFIQHNIPIYIWNSQTFRLKKEWWYEKTSYLLSLRKFAFFDLQEKWFLKKLRN